MRGASIQRQSVCQSGKGGQWIGAYHPSLWWFFNKVKRLWPASLKRRSQTARLSWERFIQHVARFFPPIRTTHPLPVTASTPEPEGGARCVSSARRVLYGGGWQRPSLP
jgi:hypothetical protein